MNKIGELKKTIADQELELARLAKRYEEARERRSEVLKGFTQGAFYQTILDVEKEFADKSEAARKNLETFAVELYKLEGKKSVSEHTTVTTRNSYSIVDPEAARAFAERNPVYMVVDEKAILQFAKRTPLPFVKHEESYGIRFSPPKIEEPEPIDPDEIPF